MNRDEQIIKNKARRVPDMNERMKGEVKVQNSNKFCLRAIKNNRRAN